jgi:uncharacterized membrane protein
VGLSGDLMNLFEQKVVDALNSLGATSEDKMKTADIIQKKCGLPKGKVSNLLIQLDKSGIVKRKVREKASGYYLK